ncbi:MAG: hypothetical protein QM769_02050 [Pseudoxanthomonas sp.]
MKTTPLALSLLALATAAMPALAADDGPQQETNLNPVIAEKPAPRPIGGYKAKQLLALETNLTPQQVRMIEHTVASRQEYRFLFQKKVAKQFKESLGSERYAAWATGHPIALHSPAVLEAVRGMANATDGHDTEASRDQSPMFVVLEP